MSKVFDKKDSKLLALYDEALSIWESSGDEEKISIALNLRCDHRVSERREKQFRDYFLSRGDLREALDDYVRETVKFASLPHFCEEWCANLVADCVSGHCCEHFDRSIDLATVVNLNGLSRPIKGTYPNLVNEMPEWRDILDSDTQASDERSNPSRREDRFDNWLEQNLKDKTLSETERFLSRVFAVLNYRLVEEKQYYNPVWVTTWERFAEHADLGADRWSQIVGVPRYAPTWQIVLRYPASKVECLYRPSQLDGGYYPQHFPSPPEATMAAGGLTMDLGMGDRAPLNEYLHRQIELDIDYWIAGGRLIGKTGTTSDELSSMRTKHYTKLIRVYEEDPIKDWMPRPI